MSTATSGRGGGSRHAWFVTERVPAAVRADGATPLRRRVPRLMAAVMAVLLTAGMLFAADTGAIATEAQGAQEEGITSAEAVTVDPGDDGAGVHGAQQSDTDSTEPSAAPEDGADANEDAVIDVERDGELESGGTTDVASEPSVGDATAETSDPVGGFDAQAKAAVVIPRDPSATFPQCTTATNLLVNQASLKVNGVIVGNKLEYYNVDDGQLTPIADFSTHITTETNGLGISGDGTLFYFIDFAIKTDPQIYRWNIDTGELHTFPAANNDPSGESNFQVRRGGVDPLSGVYYYSTTRAHVAGSEQKKDSGDMKVHDLYALNPAGESWRVGTVTSQASGQSGDIAFDAAGRMYFVVGAEKTGLALEMYAGALPTQKDQVRDVELTSINTLDLAGNGVGIAFGKDGYLFGSATDGSFHKLRPATGEKEAGTLKGVGDGGATVDLASCVSPNTITVRKDVSQRENSGDQFTIGIDRTLATGATSTTSSLGKATTAGTATGIQAQQIGPMPVLTGDAVTFKLTESAASGNLSDYNTTYQCIDTRNKDWSSSGTATGTDSRTMNVGSVPNPTDQSREIVCTIYNDRAITPAFLTLTKVVDAGDTGATATRADWELTAASVATGTTVTGASGDDTVTGVKIPAGTYTLSETGPAGYELTALVCTIDGVATDTSPDDRTFTVAMGKSVKCTFTNTAKPSTLTLVKDVVYGDETPGAWLLSATGPAGALEGPSGTTGTTGASAPVTIGSTYTLAEDDANRAYVLQGWTCTGGSAVQLQGDQITITEPGVDVTCTASNTTAKLTLLKDVAAPGTADPANWTLSATPTDASFKTLETAGATDQNDDENTWEVRPGLEYALAESLSADSLLTYYTERIEMSVDGGTSWVPVADPSAVTVDAGTHVIYRFVNAPAPSLTLPFTGGGAAADGFVLIGAMAAAGAALWAGNRLRRPAGRQS